MEWLGPSPLPGCQPCLVPVKAQEGLDLGFGDCNLARWHVKAIAVGPEEIGLETGN